VKRFDWQDAVQTVVRPTTPHYALPFAAAVAIAMVGPDQAGDSEDERRSGFAIQALYLVEAVAEAVRVNALPELRRALRDEAAPIPLGLGRVSLGDQMRAQLDPRWFLTLHGARDALRANLHLISDPEVSAAVSELVEHAQAR
jgi:hypothetical protein